MIASSRRVKAESNRRAAVAGEDGDALVGLDAREQVVGLRVGEAIVRVLDVGALAEERVGLVEEQHDLRMLGAGEELREVLLRLADVLARDAGQIDAIDGQPEPRREPAAASVLPVPDGPTNSARTPGR